MKNTVDRTKQHEQVHLCAFCCRSRRTCEWANEVAREIQLATDGLGLPQPADPRARNRVRRLHSNKRITRWYRALAKQVVRLGAQMEKWSVHAGKVVFINISLHHYASAPH